MFKTFENEADVVIKVVGIGGCGGNAINYMIEQGVKDVEFIAIDTDTQALSRCHAKTLLQISDAETAAAQMHRMLFIGDAHIIFMIAAMGGRTGTQLAQVVGEIAGDLGILTLAAVTTPFGFEGRWKEYHSNDGIEVLSNYVDALIVLPHAYVREIFGNKEVIAYSYSAWHIAVADIVADISELTLSGLSPLDFADICIYFYSSGIYKIGTATASGIARAKIAADQAVANLVLQDVDVTLEHRRLLVVITSSSALKLSEVGEVLRCLKLSSDNSNYLLAPKYYLTVGTAVNESMGEEMRVTVFERVAVFA